MAGVNQTHDPALKSWVPSANQSPGEEKDTPFPLQNLPLGIFRRRGSNEQPCAGTAIGDQILDLSACANANLFKQFPAAGAACHQNSLNALMTLDPQQVSQLRSRIHQILRSDAVASDQAAAAKHLLPAAHAELFVPSKIGNYTDFYASIHHATNVGRLFRPDQPLLPNYKHIPIAYHGRASSIVISGTDVLRPSGQQRIAQEDPVFGPSKRLDYELEVGMLIGRGNELGSPILISEATRHIFGFCLVNDWSARDIQAWEYQPLGPFLGKNFATTISPWVVTQEALEPYRVPPTPRPAGDPKPLAYLLSDPDQASGAFNIELEVLLRMQKMNQQGLPAFRLSQANFRSLYWTPAQMIAHHTSNGCNLQPGDLLASGTVSEESAGSWGSLLELTRGGREAIALPNGETRGFLEDGDEIILRGWAVADGRPRIGLGECRGIILPTPDTVQVNN